MAWFKIRTFIRYYLMAFVSTFFLVALTLFTFFEIRQRIDERNRNLFEIRAEIAKAAVEKRMTDYIQILKGAQGLFNVSDTVTLSEWRHYVENLDVDKNYPGIQGLGYAAYFGETQLAAIEAQMRKATGEPFRVWPEESRQQYTSILFLEPFDKRNQRAWGYDMYTEPVRREAMSRARDTGLPALSRMVTLVQEDNISIQNGFLLYLPVYQDRTAPKTEAGRKSSIIGFVYSPFRVNDLMQGILGKRFSDLELRIYDGSSMSAESLLFDKDSVHVPHVSSAHFLQQTTSMEVGGHTWQLYLATVPESTFETRFPYFILGGGLLISGLLFIVLFSLSNVERSNYLKQVITDNATAALFMLDDRGHCTFMNPAAESLTGYTQEEIRNYRLHDMIHHSYPDGSPFPAEKCTVMQTLETHHKLKKHEDVFFRKDGSHFYGSINAQPVRYGSSLIAYLVELRDITAEKNSEIALREKNNNLQTLNRIGQNLTSELDLKKLLQIVTDSSTELTGAEFGAFFYNQLNEKGEAYMLYTVSGVKQEAFSHFPMPRNTQIFAPTFHGKGVVRSDDITKDPRYGKNKPYKGMPEGHLPVKSYLAYPVISRNGEVIGGLFFGHSKAGVFDDKTEEVIKGIAAQSAIAIDNSRLFNAISSKNEQLMQINDELDNFVYTASHDLKAPVLNIEGLVNALISSLHAGQQDKVQQIIQMIQVSVSKFKETIQALTEVSKTNRNLDENLEKINLKELLDDIQLSIQDMIREKQAVIVTELQCEQLKFSKINLKSILLNLITNALKYHAPSRPPHVTISCIQENDSVRLSVSDNGLGIPENFLPKIFMMFKRYHTHTEGSGIGLYLVKRIVENYGGSLQVDSTENQGTTFTISIPQA